MLVGGGGRILLREPTRHKGGCVWTFAKGRPEAGEQPRIAALREVREETGYAARIIAPIPGTFAGTTGRSAFWLMDASHPPAPHDGETSRIRWVTTAEARTLFTLTGSPAGRARDNAVLAAAERVLERIPHHLRPATQPEDAHLLRCMPAAHRRLPLNFAYGTAAMESIRRGFHSGAPEQPWFIVFTTGRLRVYRKGTGYCRVIKRK